RPFLHSFPTRRSSDLGSLLKRNIPALPWMYLDPRQPLATRLRPSRPGSAVLAGQKLCYEWPDKPVFRSSLPAERQEPREPQPARSEEHTSELQSRVDL